MREAYSLLRQSIIHVEQDDIDFDEEELRGERDITAQEARAMQADESQDVDMDTEPTVAMDSASSGLDPSGLMDESGGASARASLPPPPPAQQQQAGQKRRMVITHDKYMSMQALVVLHLTEVERETGRGMDKDELIDWYLESKEAEIQDVEELEYEKELIMKMLKKLVKVR